MSLFHRHHWSETTRRFNSPTHAVRGEAEATGSGTSALAQILYGITVVELRCDNCGDVKAVRYTGSAT